MRTIRAREEVLLRERHARQGTWRRCGQASGHEVVELAAGDPATPPPVRAVLITRSDYREGRITTRQTAEAKWDVRRRERGDDLSLAMRDSQRLHAASGGRRVRG